MKVIVFQFGCKILWGIPAYLFTGFSFKTKMQLFKQKKKFDSWKFLNELIRILSEKKTESSVIWMLNSVNKKWLVPNKFTGSYYQICNSWIYHS